MNFTRLAFAAAALGLAATASQAADPGSDQARRDRMDAAYQDYRSNNPGSSGMNATDRSSTGSMRGGTTMQRTEDTIKRDAHKAGNAIKRGAHKVRNALHKAGGDNPAAPNSGAHLEDAAKPKN